MLRVELMLCYLSWAHVSKAKSGKGERNREHTPPSSSVVYVCGCYRR